MYFKDRDHHNCHKNNIAWVDAQTLAYYSGLFNFHKGRKKIVVDRQEAIRTCTTPTLFPYDPEQYWQMIREIIRQELQQLPKKIDPPGYQTPGMTYKPLYKIGEVCQIFQVTRPTIYDWVRHGKLKPYKIRSRVFFL